jgi:hypothetical protein
MPAKKSTKANRKASAMVSLPPAMNGLEPISPSSHYVDLDLGDAESLFGHEHANHAGVGSSGIVQLHWCSSLNPPQALSDPPDGLLVNKMALERGPNSTVFFRASRSTPRLDQDPGVWMAGQFPNALSRLTMGGSFAPSFHRTTARAFETRRTTLPISQ